jgi:hypothetical protein
VFSFIYWRAIVRPLLVRKQNRISFAQFPHSPSNRLAIMRRLIVATGSAIFEEPLPDPALKEIDLSLSARIHHHAGDGADGAGRPLCGALAVQIADFTIDRDEADVIAIPLTGRGILKPASSLGDRRDWRPATRRRADAPVAGRSPSVCRARAPGAAARARCQWCRRRE